MNRLVPTLVILFVVAIVFFVMWNAWRKRSAAAASIDLGEVLPVEAQLLFSLERIFYVATTRTPTPLERVSIPGLRYRGFAQLRAFDSGVQVHVRGERSLFIPRERIVGVQQQQLVIDKVTERDGLMALIWTHEDDSYSSVFRLASAAERTQLAELAQAYASRISVSETRTPSMNFTTGTESNNNA